MKITFKNLVVILLLSMSRNLAAPRGAEPVPQPAIPAILAAFDKYKVVGMSEAHRMKDEDDFILTLIRTPAFSQKVNDIVEVSQGPRLEVEVIWAVSGIRRARLSTRPCAGRISSISGLLVMQECLRSIHTS